MVRECASTNPAHDGAVRSMKKVITNNNNNNYYYYYYYYHYYCHY